MDEEHPKENGQSKENRIQRMREKRKIAEF